MSKSELSKHKLEFEQLPKQKGKKMTKTTKQPEPKTIKVKTLVIGVAVVVAIIASFIGGIITANNYNAKVTADAQELAEVISKTEAR